jgi:serine/threonine-protein kinase RsbW
MHNEKQIMEVCVIVAHSRSRSSERAANGQRLGHGMLFAPLPFDSPAVEAAKAENREGGPMYPTLGVRRISLGAASANDSWQTVRFSAAEDADPVIEAVADSMADAGYSEEDITSIRLALEEAITNAVTHGNGNSPAKLVAVSYRVGGQAVLIKVEDQGSGFDPGAVPDPSAPENLERLGGRGLFLIRAATTWVRYNQYGNCITFCKYRSAG